MVLNGGREVPGDELTSQVGRPTENSVEDQISDGPEPNEEEKNYFAIVRDYLMTNPSLEDFETDATEEQCQAFAQIGQIQLIALLDAFRNNKIEINTVKLDRIRKDLSGQG